MKTPIDIKREEDVALFLNAAWNRRLRPFHGGIPAEWYAEHQGGVASVLHIRCIDASTTEGNRVGLPFQVWFRMHMASCCMGVPALFVAKFRNGVRYQYTYNIDAAHPKIPAVEAPDNPRSNYDPVLSVPIDAMFPVHGPADWKWNEKLFGVQNNIQPS